MDNYHAFLKKKNKYDYSMGFDPLWMPDLLFDFQKELSSMSIRKGRFAIFADCGLGKTLMQITFAQNVLMKENKSVLILTPLAVCQQTIKEGAKVGLDLIHSRDGIVDKTAIYVTNYEKLKFFNADDFAAVICDESSILKCFSGKLRAQITEFMQGIKYRELCTATPSPNDYMELGTSSEALGILKYRYMLAQFFTHDRSGLNKYVLKGHVQNDIFWRWMCSWCRALQKPSDLGFDDSGFDLPKLIINDHIVESENKDKNSLFIMPAVGLNNQRRDLRETMQARCEKVAELATAHNDPVVCWCNLNDESGLIKSLVPDSVEVRGSDKEEYKEKAFMDFANGDIRVMITKPTIAGFGLNWQHCAHQTFFPSHSFEQFYQAYRRCWRFGQKREVTLDIITTEGQANVKTNLNNKCKQAQNMFSNLVRAMSKELIKKENDEYTKKEEIPEWL